MNTDSKLLSFGEQLCLVFAARYAHKLDTSAPNIVVNYAIENWDKLSLETQCQLKREAINQAVFRQDDWQRLIER